MKTIVHRFPLQPFEIPHFFAEQPFSVVDIETTGLSFRYHQVMLIGMMHFEGEEGVLTQFFAENLREEKELLTAFQQSLQGETYLLTFNGASFDIPFLKERFKKYGLHFPLREIRHFDLLQLIRRYGSHLELENLKLKTIERFLGIFREDTITGKDSVDLYKAYLKAPSPSLEKTILLHNYEDIYYLFKITKIIEHFSTKFRFLKETSLTLTRAGAPLDLFYYPEDFAIKKQTLTLKGKTTQLPQEKELIYFTPDYNFSWEPAQGTFSLALPVKELTLPTGDQVHCLSLGELKLSLEVLDQYLHSYSGYLEGHLIIDPQDEESMICLIKVVNEILANLFTQSSPSLEETIPATPYGHP